ncbi:energy-coupling factor transporter transmembrane component T [Paucidesulfovibrio longus]|uniref:energy-coupling factor transporter transmembrane component T n=1 Tax=Paucidesulfovibrio longus TaxID=889 RepID=UPI0003B7994A|nr:energy-coupling factor transporter transmembrane component T [Paucidesulfovibrio longus]
MIEAFDDPGRACGKRRDFLRLSGLDPRVKLLAALTLGVLVWRSSWPGLIAYFLFLGTVAWNYRHSWPGSRNLMRTYMAFVIFWSLAKFGLGLLGGAAWELAAGDALLVAARISCLLLLGAALTMTTSTRSMGLGLSSLLRPVIGQERAWRLALSFALMAHFLPMTWRVVEQVRETVRRRCPKLRLRRRVPLMAQAILRNLGKLTWDQSLAIAGRGMDKSEAWESRIPFCGRQWAAGLFFVLASAGVSLL